MSSWADQSEDPVLEQAPAEYTGGGGVRPRLKLMPRSANAGKDSHASGTGGSSKSNPFGAAKPREEVLASKGIDASLVDKRLEKKANIPRLTAEQDRQVENLRKELTEIEEKLREANEMELPEEDFRVAAEEKRGELNELVKGFNELNVKEQEAKDKERRERRSRSGSGGGGGAGGGRKFERPSERRRRLEQQRNEGGGSGRYNEYEEEDPYASFGGNRSRDGGGGGGGRRYSDNRGSRGGGGGYGDGGYGGYDNYNDSGNGGGGGGGRRRSNNNNYDDKYAGDRYNY